MHDLEHKYTYHDYLNWSDDKKWELIDGVPYAMSLAPLTKHQWISRELLVEFGNYLRDKSAEKNECSVRTRFFS
ncbi:Uma2 family endonuclease [Aneurinibacillus thermoaerophilus]|uniref:Uma2 family endonuclease n=2 Tax=Aneurinibacillus thermoaerophilus TaxID=143495 RepID=A0ABX8YH92_ANETH|nr:Uma2 family endonuclease [Aneurinibacillus thermoaerophilus]MED0680438.1 Uma2 family endonuclease [Aneurinibacillus thermoaerophilus]MED0737305.1 Uma2 family endonuclease [Aneurinibacillus thermoaerophilus]MED0758634.1 Uma2 family endonuclease [Aneurinibacillus thermoaerophilus]MED0761903.1 Uma2 family endonuclease [Aneurinibacillus thermoaerophilus]MED0765906.1 Uma2 family endonuclease [Aneurinibacillus thermoaerophilus]